MIDVKDSIFQSIKHWIKKLRVGADNNTTAFKHILQLIILDELFMWSHYLKKDQKIIDAIDRKRYDFIRCHKDILVMFNELGYNTYANVNLPQTDYTWKPIDPVLIAYSEIPQRCFNPVGNPDSIPTPLPYTNENGAMVYMEDGQVYCNNNSLLDIQEKMNYYIDEATETLWRMNPDTCEYERVNLPYIDEESIVNKILTQIPRNISITGQDIVDDRHAKFELTSEEETDDTLGIVDEAELNDDSLTID